MRWKLLIAALALFPSLAFADSDVPSLPAATTLSGATGYLANGGAVDNSVAYATTVFDIATGAITLKAGGVTDAMLASTFLKINPALGTPVSGVATNLTGTAAGLTAGTVTTNANLTGVITSSGNATSIASQTGTGTKFVVDTSPTLVTPNLGTPSAVVLTNATGLSAAIDTMVGGSVAQGDILYRNGTVWTRLGAGTNGQFLKTQGAAANPAWATVSASGCTTAGSAGQLLTDDGAGGCTSNTTGTGVLTFLGTPSSANLAAAVTGETGTGALVFATTPTLVTPVIGVATATSINKVALTAPATSATLTIADGKTLTDTSGTGAVALKGATGGGFAQAACADLSNGATGCSTATGTSGATIPLLNGTNTWSGVQTYTNSDIALLGSSTGKTTFTSANAGASNFTLTFPAATDTLAALGQNQTWTGTQTMGPTIFVNGPQETAVALSGCNGSTATMNLNSGSYFSCTVSAGAVTFAVSNPASTGKVSSFTLELTNGGSQTLTWMSGTKWPGGAAPTLTASGVDLIVCSTRDGATTWRCVGSEIDSK